jgi:hypothetical protein
MIQIICIKWGAKYSSEYVNRLYWGIVRNTTKRFSFTCYTEDPKGIQSSEIKIEPIPYFTGDWFSKIGLYNQELYHAEDQIFYFDLDTVITGDLDDILSYSGDFIILQDFYRPKGYGSGLMSWAPHAVNHMWTNYTKGYRARNGDQGWCEEQYPGADLWQKMYPEKIISYKIHIVNGGKQRNAAYTDNKGSLATSSIVCFHGRPNPHEVTHEPWIQQNWI